MKPREQRARRRADGSMQVENKFGWGRLSALYLGISTLSHLELTVIVSGEGNGNALQCSCLKNPRDGGAWWAAVCGVARSRTRLERLSSSSSSRDCLCTVFCIFNVLLEFYFNFFFWSGNQLLNFFDQFSLKIFQSTNFCLHLINSFLLFSSQLLGLTTQLTGQYVFPSVQFSRSVMSDSLRPYGLQHARLPCPSPTS